MKPQSAYRARNRMLSAGNENVLERFRRGEPVDDAALARALGLRAYPRLPLWQRCLHDRQRRLAARSTT